MDKSSSADVSEHFRQRVLRAQGSSILAQDLYDDYCNWCDAASKAPLSMPTFDRQLTSGLKLRKSTRSRRVRYLGVELSPPSP